MARRLDHFTSLGFTDGALRLKFDTSSWPGAELMERRGELEELISIFFGAGATLVIEEATPNPERLPFPVTSSKYWNHVAFIVEARGSYAALAVPKPIYAKLDAYEKPDSDTTAEPLANYPEIATLCAPAATKSMAEALVSFVDPLTALAKERGSYVHFLTPFPGDAEATALEARLYAVKEWGTPDTPSAIARKFLGRLHYCDPAQPLLGLRLAKTLLK
jgi:hypothetical protein